MFLGVGDGAQLVDGLPSMHEALVPSPGPRKPGLGVWACNLALRRWGHKEDHQFEVIQGLGCRRPSFRDSKKEEDGEGTEAPSVARLGSSLILHRTSSSSCSAVPASHWAPLRKLRIHCPSLPSGEFNGTC